MNRETKRKATLFISGQTVSLFGSALVQYAISWYITIATGSGVMIMVSVLCGFLPQLLISMFGGVWADRFNRRTLIILSDGMIAASTLVLAVLFNLGYQELWLLFAISAIRSLGAGVHMPAVSAFLPDIIPAEHIARVNGINNAIRSASLFVAPILSLMFYSSIGLKSVFWIDVLTAVIGIGLLLLIRYERSTAARGEKQNVFRDIRDGVGYIFKTKWLRQFIGFYIIFSVMYGPVAFLTPLMVTRSFGGEVAFMGGVLNSETLLMIHEVSFALGMTAGGIAVGVLAPKLTNKALMALIGSMVFAFTTFVMGFSHSFWFYLGVMMAMGVTLPFVNTGSMTVLQTRVEPELMGRVFGLVALVETVTLPLSMVIFGPMADSQSVSVELLLIITGVLMLAVSIAAMFLKEMIAIGRDAKKDAERDADAKWYGEAKHDADTKHDGNAKRDADTECAGLEASGS